MKTDVSSARNDVVIIILTYNQKDKTLECLTTLLDGEDMPFKVLVWNNGSHDGTSAAVHEAFPAVLTHHSEINLGVAGGRNASANSLRRYFLYDDLK